MSPFPVSTAFWSNQGHKSDEEVILFNLSKTFHEGMTKDALYEASRGVWRVDEERVKRVKLALAVAGGQVKEIYRVDRWQEADLLSYKTRDVSEYKDRCRWEFVGEPEADLDLREKFIDKKVVWVCRSSVQYWTWEKLMGNINDTT